MHNPCPQGEDMEGREEERREKERRGEKRRGGGVMVEWWGMDKDM